MKKYTSSLPIPYMSHFHITIIPSIPSTMDNKTAGAR